jgi:hypothetical protein
MTSESRSPSESHAPLAVSVSEGLCVGDVGSPEKPLHAVVAVLDALGAADYSKKQVDEFLDPRTWIIDEIPRLLQKYLKRYEPRRLLTFTFNDSVVIAYLVDDMSLKSVAHFETACHMLRGFQTLSITRGILFRGAFAVGEVYRADLVKNTIMGPAVSDAAAWYASADWIGLSATPHATMFFDGLIPQLTTDLKHLLVPHEVPLKNGERPRLRAVNWPKGFYVEGLSPEGVRVSGKTQIRTLLSQHRIPRGSEAKYANTVAFFDQVYVDQELAKLERPAEPSPAASEAEEFGE